MKFSIGDQVKLVSKPNPMVRCPKTFNNSWNWRMDSYVNNNILYTIESIEIYGIKFKEDNTYYWPPTALQFIKKYDPQDRIKEKINYLWNKSKYAKKTKTA